MASVHVDGEGPREARSICLELHPRRCVMAAFGQCWTLANSGHTAAFVDSVEKQPDS